jgi:hypothetical protein
VFYLHSNPVSIQALKRLLSIFPFLLALFLVNRIHAFNNTTEIPGGFRKMLVADGLPSSEVYEVYQDRKGYLWLATDAGVCRYNGVSFTTYTSLNGLTDNTAFHIKEDSEGRIWVQTFTGAVCYFSNNRFWPIPANDSLVKLYSNGQKTQYTFFVDANDCIVVGGLYVGGCYRISPIDGYKTITHIKPPMAVEQARNIWTDSLGQLYCYGESVYEGRSAITLVHNGHAVTIPIEYSIKYGINVRLTLTKDNTILFSHQDVLYAVDANGDVKNYQMPGVIIGVCQDQTGAIWVNLLQHGTVRYAQGDLEKPGISYLEGYSVSYVCQDAENGYWFSTVGNGLLYLAGLEFGYLTQSEGLPPFSIASMYPLGKGQILLGQAFSTVTIIGTRDSRILDLKSGTVGYVNEIATDFVMFFAGRMLANTDRTYFIDSSAHFYGTPDPNRHLKGYVLHPDGDTLFGYSHSAFVWITRDFKEVKASLAPERITSACYQQKTLWLGGLNGLWKMSDSVPEYKVNLAPGLSTRIDDMVGDHVGRLWIATRGNGVFVLDHDTVHHFDNNSGLNSNTCRSIALDDQNNIWVATNHGISVISDYNGFKGTATISGYNTTDGLLSDEVNFIEFRDGIIWMAGPDGLCWVPTNKLLVNLTPPPVYINTIYTGNDTMQFRDSLEVEYRDNRIRILCEGVSLRNPSKITYKYKLSESSEWVRTSNPEITFSNLDPGDYTFVVYALNSNSVSSRNPAILHIHIIRPFVKTIWFYLLLALILFSAIYLGVRLRLNTIRQKAARRSSEERRMAELRLSALRAQMNPHFIFNAINSIQHYILNNDSDKAYGYLAKFSKLIRLVLDQSQANTITLKQELDLLQLYVELEQLRFERPIDIEWFVAPTIEQSSVRLPGMLIQPYIENAIWHGLLPLKKRGGRLVISFEEKGEDLLIVVEDNGIGRAAAAAGKKDSGRRSYGMLITSERLKLLDKSDFSVHRITVIDLKDVNGEATGTRVEILLRLSNLHDKL